MLSNNSAVMNNSLVSRRIQYGWDLLREMVSRDMKVRYKRSVVGIVWSILNPLAHLAVLAFVFSVILQNNIPNFTMFLFCGVLPWSWFSSGLNAGAGAIVNNAPLIRKPGFPIPILPVVSVTTQLVHFVIALPILMVGILLSGLPLTPALVALPLVIAVQFVTMLSLVYILAAINVTFRDTKYLLDIALFFGFYLSPIFYQPQRIPEHILPIYNLNPMVHIITAYRSIFLLGTFPLWLPLLTLGSVSLVLLALSHRLFIHSSYRFVEEL